MLEWLTGKKNRKDLPEYSALRAIPTRGVPPDLAEAEGSESFATSREGLEHELRKLPRRPLEDEPLFMELLEANGSGVVTITLPDHSGRCLPVFSTPFRAFDYVQTLLPWPFGALPYLLVLYNLSRCFLTSKRAASKRLLWTAVPVAQSSPPSARVR